MANAKKIEATPESEVQRLKQAASLLEDNPLWQEAMDVLEAEYTKAWRDTSAVQQTQRENAYHMVQAIGQLRKQIQAFTKAGAFHKEHTRKNVAG